MNLAPTDGTAHAATSRTAATPDATPRVLVSLATYNEAGNIAALITEIRRVAPQADILVIDDNSPDGTAAIVQELAGRASPGGPALRLLKRPGKLGLGTAILTAMRFAIDHCYDYLLNLDADFSHPPEAIPRLLAGMRRHDVMIGSRYVPGGGTRNWPLPRRIISRCVNWLVRFLFRTPARDSSGAYRCYRVALLRQMPLDRVLSRGYSFQQEVLFRCHKAGGRIGETPILFENRRVGASKVNWREALRSISMILYLGVRNWLGWEPRRQTRTATATTTAAVTATEPASRTVAATATATETETQNQPPTYAPAETTPPAPPAPTPAAPIPMPTPGGGSTA